MTPLVSVSPLWGFPALFGPALAAIMVVAVADGRAGLRDLLGRMVRWRVRARWYGVALGLPAVLALAAAGLHVVFGPQTSVQLGGPSVLNFVVFVLIVGEELGWRGSALPKLLAERSALSASLSLGAIWGACTCRRSLCRERHSTGCRQRRCTRKRDLRSSLTLRAARLRPTRFPC